MSREFVAGNVFIREMDIPEAGMVIEGHTHNFDHVTYVVRGAIKIEALREDDSVAASVVKRASDGRNFVLIKAEVRHRITAVEAPAMVHCVYSHRNPQGEVVLEYDGWAPSYV